ncbi:MAG: AAA family ATPase [Treponema sp.]|nr:AAA family ATPase [Treponema sp.]
MERIKLSDLEKWLHSSVRKPLIVWGARQVGKTYLVKELFAKRYFKDFLYIDLKKDEQSRAFFSTTSDADKYITYIEVQQCHQVLSSLKYFCQDHKELPVIATGSLVSKNQKCV